MFLGPVEFCSRGPNGVRTAEFCSVAYGRDEGREVGCLGRLRRVPSDGQLKFDGELRRSRGRLLVAEEVAAMLRVTKAWVYAETRAGRIPCVRLGRYYRYRASAIAAWLEEVEQR